MFVVVVVVVNVELWFLFHFFFISFSCSFVWDDRIAAGAVHNARGRESAQMFQHAEWIRRMRRAVFICFAKEMIELYHMAQKQKSLQEVVFCVSSIFILFFGVKQWSCTNGKKMHRQRDSRQMMHRKEQISAKKIKCFNWNISKISLKHFELLQHKTLSNQQMILAFEMNFVWAQTISTVFASGVVATRWRKKNHLIRIVEQCWTESSLRPKLYLWQMPFIYSDSLIRIQTKEMKIFFDLLVLIISSSLSSTSSKPTAANAFQTIAA